MTSQICRMPVTQNPHQIKRNKDPNNPIPIKEKRKKKFTFIQTVPKHLLQDHEAYRVIINHKNPEPGRKLIGNTFTDPPATSRNPIRQRPSTSHIQRTQSFSSSFKNFFSPFKSNTPILIPNTRNQYKYSTQVNKLPHPDTNTWIQTQNLEFQA